MNIEDNLLTAIKASLEAGKEILAVYDTDFAVESKEDRSPLTEADKRSHEVINRWLKRTGIPELSEEGKHTPFEQRQLWDSLWIIDPLDGTKEFIKRNGEFTVNIALVRQQKPILGVIYIPVTGELYFSSIGKGAYKYKFEGNELGFDNADQIRQKSTRLPLAPGSRPFTVVCSRSHLSRETEEFVDALRREHSEIDYASRGSSLKFCLIAEGGADVYPRFAPTMEWDTAAGQAIVEALGGKVIRHDTGEKLLYNKEELLNPWFIVYSSTISTSSTSNLNGVSGSIS
jgi:3'(2'), 5'-bisphosphate nucleotidase